MGNNYKYFLPSNTKKQIIIKWESARQMKTLKN